MKSLPKRFAANQCATTSIEYALIASLAALVIITTVTAIGTSLSTTFNTISTRRT